MEPDNSPGPIRETLGEGTGRILQVASSVVTAAQVLVYLSRAYVNARRENGPAVALALAAQQRAEQIAARVGLAAIRDPGWLDNADLNRTIQAWAALMPYADRSLPWHHHSAATVMRKAEERLRVLHPAAMARYDQLRSEGADPAYAMLQAVPLFGHPPGPHGTPPASPQPSLIPNNTTAPARARPIQADAGATASSWEQDFPLSIGEVLTAAGDGTAAAAAARPPVPSQVPRTGRQP